MFARLAAALGKISDSPLLTGLMALACGLVFGLLEFAIMRSLVNSRLSSEHQAIVDAAIITVGTGTFAWVLLLGHRARRKRLREELDRIAEVNHEIRNALQVITHTQYMAEPHHRDMVMASVGRIDAVLKRLFPLIGRARTRRGLEPPPAERRDSVFKS